MQRRPADQPGLDQRSELPARVIPTVTTTLASMSIHAMGPLQADSLAASSQRGGQRKGLVDNLGPQRAEVARSHLQA